MKKENYEFCRECIHWAHRYCHLKKEEMYGGFIIKKCKGYNKDKIKVYCEKNKQHKLEHPEEYLNVLGTYVYTNGITKKLKKELPNLINKKIKEILRRDIK